jgi:NDP-sugar pyrophosphorylase family protein
MPLTLVILAAGMGSRYGGLKQVDPVGPSGETMLDFAVFDAIRAGFDHVVFVIRRDFESAFREQVARRFEKRIAVDYVFQALTELPAGFVPPAGREKPWGTGHAVWCARDAVKSNFAVINADDFYGADSFAQLGRFLKTADAGATPAMFAMVGFRLANTLSEHGTVSRGICSVSPAGALSSIVEQTNILPAEVGPGKIFSGDESVSMNCWGFTPALFPLLDERLKAFLKERSADLRAEFYLPAAVSEMISRREASVKLLPTESAWFGVTYREDRPRVHAAIAELAAAGKYPRGLWA